MPQHHTISKWLRCPVCDLLVLSGLPSVVLGEDVCGHNVDPGGELALLKHCYNTKSGVGNRVS